MTQTEKIAGQSSEVNLTSLEERRFIFFSLDKALLPFTKLQGASIELRYRGRVLGSATVAAPAILWDTKVCVEPPSNAVHPGERFKIQLHIKNPTTLPQEIQVWTCGWRSQWETSNTDIGFEDVTCTRNFPEAKIVAAGESYTQEITAVIYHNERLASLGQQERLKLQIGDMGCLVGGIPSTQRGLKFKMGFTSWHSPRTYWSDEIKINVMP